MGALIRLCCFLSTYPPFVRARVTGKRKTTMGDTENTAGDTENTAQTPSADDEEQAAQPAPAESTEENRADEAVLPPKYEG